MAIARQHEAGSPMARKAAEDLVQETIEAALRQASSFAGNSTLKTWVFSILRNRVIDYLRQADRTVAASSLVGDGEDWQDQVEDLFNERGGWLAGARPVSWPDPEDAMRHRQFWAVFEACPDHLPDSGGRAFMMREFLGFETEEICLHLKVTKNNCHVLLHRARLKLRGCLQSGKGAQKLRKC
jgi:RNA polymerase sigma-70 factor (ECF subfamily)